MVFAMKLKELSGRWELCAVKNFPSNEENLDGWLTMGVPSHWQDHPALCDHTGKVVYRKTFSIRKRKAGRYRITLPGVFYWSTVFLNGVRLGAHEGYFNARIYDVTDIIKNKNRLVVHVDCPDEKSKNNKRMITGVFSHWDCLDPKANPGGIWLAPWLSWAKSGFIDDVKIHAKNIRNKSAELTVRVEINSDKNIEGKLNIQYNPENFKGASFSFDHNVELVKGNNSFDFTHTLKNPRLWWPHDLGRANLYKAGVSLFTGDKKEPDHKEEIIGLRTVEVRDWIFYINGVRLYIKGNNYAPSDTRIASVKKETIKKDLRLAKKCNMNMLRVHAHIDHPEFYKAADREGMLVWQDFPLQWSYKREILHTAKKQIGQMVRLLYNHPSIVTWCCHNEAIYLVDTKDEDIVNISKSVFSIFFWSWNRDVLDNELKAVVALEDPSRFVNRSSGEPAFLKKGGDTHFYFGWYRVQGPKRNFDKVIRFTPKNVRFVTEFGAQSFPNYESSIKFMDKDVKKIDWRRLQERNSLQTDLMDHWIGLSKHDSLKKLIEASQEYQSRINQYYIDRIRAKKYAPGGGVLPFMFNDSNPAIQWSIVDYWRVPKKSYYAMQKQLAPQYVFVLLEKEEYKSGEIIRIPVFAVNDLKKNFEDVKIEISLTSPGGKTVLKRGFDLAIPEDGPAILVAQLNYVAGSLGLYKLDLKMSHLKFSIENDYFFEVK